MLIISICVLMSVSWLGLASAATLTPGNWIEAETDVNFSGNVNKESDGLNYHEFGRVGLTLEVQQAGYYKLIASGKTIINAGALDLIKDGATLSRVYVGELGNWILVNGPLYLEPGKHQVHFNVLISFFLDWFALAPVNNPNDIPTMNVKGQPLSAYGTMVQGTPIPDALNWLKDSSFESVYGDQKGDITKWGRFVDPPAGIEVTFGDPNAAFFGERGLSVNNTIGETLEIVQYNDMGYDQAVLPAMAWGFSGWVKCETPGSMELIFSSLFFSGDWQIYSGQYDLKFDINNSDWKYISGVVPAGKVSNSTDHFIFQLNISGIGKISLDGFAFHPISNVNWQQAETNLPLQVTEAEPGLQLTWPAQVSNQFYEIHRGETPDFALTSATRVARVTETSWIDSQPDLTKLTYYKVRNINSSFRPTITEAKANDIFPPNTIVAAPTIDNSVGGVLKVMWLAPQAAFDGEVAEKYLIYRAENAGELGKGQPVKTLAHQVGTNNYVWEDTGVIPGKTYFYAIRCADRGGLTSSLSPASEGKQTTPDELPANPVETLTSNNLKYKGAITLIWERPAPHEKDYDLPATYDVYRSTTEPVSDLEGMEKIGSVIAASDITYSYIDPNIPIETIYYYKVVTLDKVGNQNVSPHFVSGKAFAPVIATPVGPNAQELIVSQPLSFSWEAPVIDCEDKVDFYELEYAAEASFIGSIRLPNLADSTAKLGVNLAAGTYFWRIHTHYKSGVISTSAPSSFRVLAESTFPVNYFDLDNQKTTPQRNLSYVLQNDGWVTLKIYDSKGKLIRTLVNHQWQTAKENNLQKVYRINWDGKDEQGKNLVNGLYIGQLLLEQKAQRPLVINRRFQVYQ
jgi:hypothetical protein